MASNGKKDVGSSDAEASAEATSEAPKEPAAEEAEPSGGTESPASGAEAEESEAKAAEDPAEAFLAKSPDAEPARGPAPPPAPPPKAWGAPFDRFEKGWTRFEARLLTAVLVAELLSLVSWVFLNGLSEPPGAGDAGTAGTVFRGAFIGTALGVGAWVGSKKMPLTTRRFVTVGALVLGVVLAPVVRSVGIGFFDNLKGWLQEGSTITLMGGLRGIATRLTLWLAFLGGSLATGAGRHIYIDLVFRFLPKKLRVPAAMLNYCAAAAVCFAGVWGFFDHIAIESYGAKADDTAGEKIDRVTHEARQQAFLTWKQVGLDFRTLPRVLGGNRYDQWMTGKDWNAWVDGAGFESRYTAEQIASIRVPDDTPSHLPLVVAPDGATTRGMLVHTLGMIIPFGLLAIGLRFLLRAVLALSGHVSVDPDEAHKEDLGPSAQGAA